MRSVDLGANAAAARREVANALGIAPEKVTINVTLLGGGFGRKSKPDFATEAALLSREMNKPVRVQWTRTDDLRHGFFHTVSSQALRVDSTAAGGLPRGIIAARFQPSVERFRPKRALRAHRNSAWG